MAVCCVLPLFWQNSTENTSLGRLRESPLPYLYKNMKKKPKKQLDLLNSDNQMNWWIRLTSVLDHLDHFIICVLLTLYQHFIFKNWQENLICRSGHHCRALQRLISFVQPFTHHTADELIMNGFLHKQTASSNAVLTFVKIHWAHALWNSRRHTNTQEVLRLKNICNIHCPRRVKLHGK